MKGEQFIAEVKNLAELDNDEDVQKVIGVTLETLKERLAGEEPSDLAAQLPPEIALRGGRRRTRVLPRGGVLRAGGTQRGRRQQRRGHPSRPGGSHGLADGRHGGAS